jgi:competence protein ComEC
LKDWLAADADPRDLKDKTLHAGVLCDALGCIGRLANGQRVAYDLSPLAFAEDCTHASVVISRRQAPRDCAARLIDRDVWRARGAVALRWDGGRFIEEDARPLGIDRPWWHAPPGRMAQSRKHPPDATPKPEDMEEGD